MSTHQLLLGGNEPKTARQARAPCTLLSQTSVVTQAASALSHVCTMKYTGPSTTGDIWPVQPLMVVCDLSCVLIQEHVQVLQSLGAFCG